MGTLGGLGAGGMNGATSRTTAYRTALRHRDFRLLVLGRIVDQSGSWASIVALTAFVYSATHSAAWLAAASLARFLPPLLFSRYAGVIAERVEGTRALALTSLASAGLMIGLAAVTAFEAPVAVALLIAAVTAATTSAFSPATSALLPHLLGGSDLAAGKAVTNTAENVAVIVGPAVGTGLLLLTDPSVVFLVNAATLMLFADLVLRIRTRSRPPVIPTGGTAGSLRESLTGLRQMGSSSAVALLVGCTVLVSLLYGVDTVLLVVVSDLRLGTGPEGFGYLLAGLGLGGAAAAGLVNRLASSPRPGPLITLGTILYSLPTAALVWVHAPAVAFGLQVLRGGGMVVVNVMAVTALQRRLRSDVVGRLFGAFWALVLAGMSMGALITPPLLSAFGLDAVLLIFSVGVTAVALTAFPGLRRLDGAALARLRRLEPRINLFDVAGIFAGTSRPVLERLAASAKEFAVAPGTVVMREGDPPEALYVLEIGAVAVRTRGEAGSTGHRTLEAPALFGQSGLMERIPRTSTVEALVKCRLLRLDVSDFLYAVATSPAPTSLPEGSRSGFQGRFSSSRERTSSAPARPVLSGG